MNFYRILSLKHSPIGNACVWWRPNCAGYTDKVDDAGLYSEEEVNGNLDYYDNGESTRAILADTVLAKSHTAVAWPFPEHV